MKSASNRPVFVEGVGLIGPGFNNWNQASLLFAAEGGSHVPAKADTGPADTVIPAPLLLPPAERRRAGAAVKLALAVAQEACQQATCDATALPTVFSASSGDGLNCHLLCEALAQAERAVSPTRFTNSVHNAAAGYWHIGQRSMAPSTSLCGFDGSFALGLMEAAVQCRAGQQPVLLVCADVPYPEPLQAKRPIPQAMGIALVLTPRATARSLTALTLSSVQESGVHPTVLAPAPWEALRRAVPAARALPWLMPWACRQPGSAVIEGLPDWHLTLTWSS